MGIQQFPVAGTALARLCDKVPIPLFTPSAGHGTMQSTWMGGDAFGGYSTCGTTPCTWSDRAALEMAQMAWPIGVAGYAAKAHQLPHSVFMKIEVEA